MKEFNWWVRVYYEDTDVGGVVYHARYLHFYERARTEMLRQLQINQSALLKKDIAFVVKKMTIDYVTTAHLDELLVVYTSVIAIKKASLVFKQVIVNQSENLVNQMDVVVACIDTVNRKPIAFPASIRMEFN